MKKDSFCSFCGTEFSNNLNYPKLCSRCGNSTYKNPIPVAVAVIPYQGGLIGIKRRIEPKKGSINLPGVYIDFGESLQKACQRECKEETGIEIDANQVKLFNVHSAPDGTVLVFGLSPELPNDFALPKPDEQEVSEIVTILPDTPIGFPLHKQIIDQYFQQ